VGDDVMVLGPRGAFALYPADDGPVVLAATGVGITPILTMLEAIACENRTRPVRLLYGTRSEAETAFRAEIAQIGKELADFQLIQCFSRPGAKDDLGNTYQMEGRLSGSHLLAAARQFSDPDFYLCGQEAFIREAVDTLMSAGIPLSRLHHELFGPSRLTRPVDGPQPAFEIHFRRSAQRAIWAGTQRSLLAFAEAQGLQAPSGCRYGACQACALTLIEGQVEHDEGIQPPPEANRFLACCARPKSDLIVDL